MIVLYGETKPFPAYGYSHKVIQKDVFCCEYFLCREEPCTIEGCVYKGCSKKVIKNAMIFVTNGRFCEKTRTDHTGHYKLNQPFLHTVCNIRIYKNKKRLLCQNGVCLNKRKHNFYIV